MTPTELRELADTIRGFVTENQIKMRAALREYADLKELLQAKFTSGNSVPVERIVITRSEVAPLLALKGDKP